ncbi:MAG: ferrous iron transport protein B, partial [SAR324 cluster bacterium]|nr:ferrous iron transport protein B [SAR324 cluster bacterium]
MNSCDSSSSVNEKIFLRVAIVGNPNSGKTTLFNAMTGSNYKVANYPGVTVERKEGEVQLEGDWRLSVVDLPGIYSLFGHSPDEMVASSVISNGRKPGESIDAMVIVVDATNLERNLYLALQLIDMGVPIVVALTKIDLARKKGLKVYDELLSRQLGVPVIPVMARDGIGIEALVTEALHIGIEKRCSSKSFEWLKGQPALKEGADRVANVLNKGFIDESDKSRRMQALALISGLVKGENDQIQKIVLEEVDALKKKGIDPYTIEAQCRFEKIKEIKEHVSGLSSQGQSATANKIDSLLTHRFWGTLIFLVILGTMFQMIFFVAAYPMALIEMLMNRLAILVVAIVPPGALQSLLVDGVIAGVGSVVSFLPQIAILFFFIAILEDSGYMVRAAYLMDRVMSILGLQGRSFIPLLNSFACAVPGIMSARIIPSPAARITTILIAPLMSCSARLPVYTLLIAAFIPKHYVLPYVSLQGLVMLALYLLGVFVAAGVALILKWTVHRKENSYFVMEMPAYSRPSMKVVWREVRDRIKIFLNTAGRAILFCSILFWFMASYPKAPPDLSP